MTPQTPPTDRPLTAGDWITHEGGPNPVPGQRVDVEHEGKWITEDVPSDQRDDLWRHDDPEDDMNIIAYRLSRPAASAASEGEATVEELCETIILTAGYQLLTESNARKIAERILAALASPPVSERERELEGALAPFAAIARVMENRDRMALGKLRDDNDVVASVSWEGGLGVLVMGHLRDALTLVPNPKGWGGLYRRAPTAQPAGEGK